MTNLSVSEQVTKSNRLEERLLIAFQHLSIEARQRETRLLEMTSRWYIGKTKDELEARDEEYRLFCQGLKKRA